MRPPIVLSLSLACLAAACGDDSPTPSGGTQGEGSTGVVDESSSGGPNSSSGTTSEAEGSTSAVDGSSSSSGSEQSSSGDTGAPCDDRDCTEPPAASCLDGFTVSTPAAMGACVDGACVYVEDLLDCEYGCDQAQCTCLPGPVCTDGVPLAATTWLSADAVQQPRVASLGCSQVVAARATIGGMELLRLWIVDHQGNILDETTLDVPGGWLDVTADHGIIALTWHDQGEVFAALFDDALDPIGTTVPLSDPGRELRSPTIAPTSDGAGFVAVYYGEDGLGGFGLFSRVLDRNGNLVGGEHTLGVASGQLLSGCYTYPDVATGAGGTMAVWNHCESGTRSVYAVPVDASGATAGASALVDEASAGSIAPGRVAVSAFETQFAVTYNNDRLAAVPNSGDVYVTMVDAAAQVVAGPENATEGTWGGGKFWPEIAAGPGALVLAWYSPIAAPGDRRVLMRTIDPATAMPSGMPIDASLETGTEPFFHLYPTPFVGPEGFGVIFPSDTELLLVSHGCPPAP